MFCTINLPKESSINEEDFNIKYRLTQSKQFFFFLFEENTLQNGFCWCLEENLEKDAIFFFMKSSKILSKFDTLLSISQSGVDFGQIKNKFLKALGVKLLTNQKCSQFFFAFCLFYESYAA